MDGVDALIWGVNSALLVGLAAVGGSMLPALRGTGAPFTRTASSKVARLFEPGGVLDRHPARTRVVDRASTSCSLKPGLSVATAATATVGAGGSKPRAAQTLVDLGSGDGVLVRAACLAGFGKVVGYETNRLVHYCAVAATTPAIGVASSPYHAASLIRSSFWGADLTTADVVLVYGIPPIMERLEAKLLAELPAGAVCVSNAYPFGVGWEPVEVLQVQTPPLHPDQTSALYVYRKHGG